ncbi:MAG: DUF4328 domain-containing protein [Myxococcales bacterium]|nr:DUF4328 domain-containing protein [Myxococcales bacterium]
MDSNPYAHSEVDDIARRHPGARSLDQLQLVVTALLGLTYGMMVLSLVFVVLAVAIGGEGDLPPTLALAIALCWLSIALTGLAAIPAWAMWHYRAASNLVALGRTTPMTPAVHALAWFVPILNLWWPYQAMVQLHTGSNPRYTSDAIPIAPNGMGLWWVLHLMGSLVNCGTGFVGFLLGMPLVVIAGILYLRFMRQITTMQHTLMQQSP